MARAAVLPRRALTAQRNEVTTVSSGGATQVRRTEQARRRTDDMQRGVANDAAFRHARTVEDTFFCGLF